MKTLEYNSNVKPIKVKSFFKRFSMIIYALIFLLNCIIINATAATTPVENNHYYIRNVGTGKYLTVVNYSSDSLSAYLVQQTLHYYSTQSFQLVNKITQNNLEYYELLSNDCYTQLRVDVDNANDSDGTNIKVFKRNPSYIGAQQFCFMSNGDGTFRIKPQISNNRVLEVVNGSTAENTIIQLYTYKGLDHQKWEIVNANYFLNSYDLVDSGKHIDWENNSTFSSTVIESATQIWNSYKPGVLREDNAFRIKDLEIENDSSMPYLGLTYSSGLIKLSDSLVFQSDACVATVLAHEFGHTLGLDHINDPDQLMNHTYTKNFNSLNRYDELSYDKAYTLY